MAETSVLGNFCGLVSIIFSLVYRLTVKLTVEFIKIGTLFAILAGALVWSGLAFTYWVVWAYTASGGSIMAALGACAVGCLLVAAMLWLLQVLVKDVLGLTDLTLAELAGVVVSATFRKGKGQVKGVGVNSEGEGQGEMRAEPAGYKRPLTRSQSGTLKKDT